MRGGRAVAVAGVPDQPDTFYFGSVGGGVWKTENSGRTWQPIADEGIPIGSIGAMAVSPSNPDIIYVGTGETDIRSQHSYGIGMYKSIDRGRSWHHIGLEATRHIGRVVIDAADPDCVYVAALGHVYDGNSERGLYRTEDGGATWKKVLFNAEKPNDVGAIDVAVDPKDPRTLYASLWATRRPPWSVYAPTNMPGSGLFKSTDRGNTWKRLTGGLPDDQFLGRIGIAVSPSRPTRLWAIVDDLGAGIAPAIGPPGRPSRPAGANKELESAGTGGLYMSDDAGLTWVLANNEKRLWGRGWYFGGVTVDPTDPNRVYVMNTATYMTADAGKTFVPVKGAPGGDDYHQMWINPRDHNRIVLSSDQGTVVSVDSAKTWSTWYNQPTAQIYHVAADNRFPYWLYGAQQDSGAVSVSTWSSEGTLSFRNWAPICLAGESNTVVPDPKDPNFLYGGGARCDQRINAPAPLGGKLPAADPSDPNRKTWTLPEVFSPVDDAVYFSNQFVMRSRDRGKTWQKISPDLSRINPPAPATLDPLTAKDIDQEMTDRFGVVYTISPSPLKATTVWVGTDDGLVYVTRDDGKRWSDVTPPPLTAWSKVSQVEAGHFDSATAYASVDRHRLGDERPYLYRTHDGGKTWREIIAGIPEGAFVNCIREDTQAKGLLYAATELRVYVSFNDGERWQPLQNNMPVTSIRDIIVHGDDLAIATHGRGFWVLDQMSALRQIAARGPEILAAEAYLFVPGESSSVIPGGMNGTPLPHEEPQERNPPPGVTAYYWLKSAANGPLKLELVDSLGATQVCAASDQVVPPVDLEALNVEPAWALAPPIPTATAGMHRFSLAPQVSRRRPPNAQSERLTGACASSSKPNGNSKEATAEDGRGQARLQPGKYTVVLSVGGQTYRQAVTVKPDPRLSSASDPATAAAH